MFGKGHLPALERRIRPAVLRCSYSKASAPSVESDTRLAKDLQWRLAEQSREFGVKPALMVKSPGPRDVRDRGCGRVGPQNGSIDVVQAADLQGSDRTDNQVFMEGIF